MPLGAMEERSNWTGRLEEGKRKGNEKDQGKTSPKSIAWAVSKTKDGWRHATAAQMYLYDLISSGRLSRAATRLQAAVDAL